MSHRIVFFNERSSSAMSMHTQGEVFRAIRSALPADAQTKVGLTDLRLANGALHRFVERLNEILSRAV